jgi:hypothetical protein
VAAGPQRVAVLVVREEEEPVLQPGAAVGPAREARVGGRGRRLLGRRREVEAVVGRRRAAGVAVPRAEQQRLERAAARDRRAVAGEQPTAADRLDRRRGRALARVVDEDGGVPLEQGLGRGRDGASSRGAGGAGSAGAGIGSDASRAG